MGKKRRYVRQVESKHQKWKREREDGNRRLAKKLAKKRLEILSKRKTISCALNSPKSPVFNSPDRSSTESLPTLKSEFVTPVDVTPVNSPERVPVESPIKSEFNLVVKLPVSPKKLEPTEFALPMLEKVG